MGAGTADPDDAANVFAEGVRIIGSASATARLLDVSQPTVWRWLKARKPCPADHVPIFEAATGISRARLRPDLFGQPESTPTTGSYNGARA